MNNLTSELLGRACRVFLDVAYAGQIASLPENKRAYYGLGGEQRVEDFLPPANAALGIGQKGASRVDGQISFQFRLGCAHYRNLKLHLQTMDFRGESTWVFSVDTHDAFSPACPIPPSDHPDAPEWLELQRKNAELKQKIEAEFDAQGVPTFKALLRRDLN